jgi:hypothetical protein
MSSTALPHASDALPQVASRVDMYLRILPGPAGYKVHYGTWHSLVLGLGAAGALRAARRRAAQQQQRCDNTVLLCCAVLCCAVLCCAVPRCVVWCGVVKTGEQENVQF